MSDSAPETATAAPDLNRPGLTITTPPAPAAPAELPAEPATPAATADDQGSDTDDGGKGGKQAILADLAKERDKRQALEQQFSAFKDAMSSALGLTQDEQPPAPEQLAEQLATEKAAAQQARLELAVFRSAPADVDVSALLDSRTFTDAIAGIDPTDQAKINAAIEAAVQANPRFKTSPATPAPGVRAAAAGGTPRPASSMDDWLRGGPTK